MPDTVVSIQIKDRIGNKIAPKLLAIGESANAAAPALARFKKAWQGLDFSGLSGVGLGSVAQQMKRTATEAKKLDIAIERLKQSQIQTKIVTNNYQQSLNKLRIQEQKMAKEGMAKAAATTSQSMALKNLNQVTNVTAISTSNLTAKQIKSQLAINRLAISNNDLKMSNDKVKISTIDLQMKQNSLAISANAVVSSTQNVAKSQKQVTTATNAAASSTVSLNKNLNTLTVQEAKLEKEGLGAAAAQNRLRAAMVGMAQSSNVTATFTSRLSKEEIKRQTSLAKLAKTQTLAKKATVDLAIAQAKLAGAYNRNTAATQKFDTATKKANLSVTRLVANIRRMKAAAVGNRGAIGGMVSSLRSYVSLGALIGAGGALKGIDSFKRIENQLRGTTSSSAQLKQVTEELFGVAQRARVPIADLTIAYRRYDNALSKVGMGQKGSLRITETIGKMLSLNGASAQESASALLQLSQAFNKGKLDGDEFRSVAELMPQILDAIAKATGRARSELFKMSKDGEITVDVLIKAFESLEKPIDKLMNNSVRTIGQSFTQLTNKLIYQFGQWDKKTKFTEKLAKTLDEIGNNLDYILKGLRSLAAGLAASGAASMVGGFFALVISGVGNIALIPGIIGLITARIVYLGDIIKFTFGKGFFGEDLSLSLTEIINNVMFNFERLFKFATDLADAFFEVLIPEETAQGLANVFLEILSIVKDVMTVITGIIAGIGKAISNLISGVNDAKTDTDNFANGFESSLGKAARQIFKLVKELPIFLFGQMMKLGSVISSALAPVIATITFEISSLVDRIEWTLSNLKSIILYGAKYEDPYAMRDVGEAPMKEVTTALESFKNARWSEQPTGIFGLSMMGGGGPTVELPTAAEMESQKNLNEALKIMKEIKRNNPFAGDKKTDEMFKKRISENKKLQLSVKQAELRHSEKLEKEHTERMDAWEAKREAERQRVQKLRDNDIQSRASKIQELAKRTVESIDLTLSEKTPSANKFLDDIFSGMTEFKNKTDGLFKGVIASIQQTAIKGFSNLKLPAQFENQIKGLGLVINFLTKSFENLGQTAIPILERLSEKINNPLLKAGLNFLITTLKDGTEGLNNLFDNLRKGTDIKAPASSLGTGLNEMTQQASVLQSVFGNLSNAFQNFVRTGKLSFKELMRSILADLLKLFMNNLFKQLFGSMMGGGGGFLGGLFGGGGGFSGGGAVPSASTSFSDGSGFGFGFKGYDSFGTYANGGYTGGVARNSFAGFVHGQEYVMPASQTTKYRSTLDAMRNGTLKTGSTAGGGVMVNVNNYTDSNVSVERNKNGELELTIREIARQQIAEQTPKLISANLRNANSRESKALGQSTYTRRKR